MEIRHGTCSACKSSFRIPSSFQANKAKCSKCGGVVQINDAVAEAPAAHSRNPSHTPARAPAPARASGKTSGSSSRSSAGDSDSDHGERHGKKYKRDRGIPIGLKVAFAIGAPILFVGAYMTYKYQVDAAEAAKQEEVDKADRASLEKHNAEVKKQHDDDEAKKLAAIGKGISDANKAGADGKPAEPVKAAAPKPTPKPVEGFDVSTIADFGPAEGTTPEQWKELTKLAATFADYDAGAASTAAGDKLEDTPKVSFPALLNQIKKQNLETDKGSAVALSMVKMLERMCPRSTIRWRSNLEKDWIKYNQQAIKKWCDLWVKASADAPYWEKITTKLVKVDSFENDTPAPTKPPAKK